MKKSLTLRRYAVTIGLSVLAAGVIDTAINFDDTIRAFEKGRGKVSTWVAANEQKTLTARLARLTGLVYTVVFER